MAGSNGRGRGTVDLRRGFGDCGSDERLGGGPIGHKSDGRNEIGKRGSEGILKCRSEEREMVVGEAY